MEVNDSSQDGIEFESYPLDDKDDETLALVLEGERQEVKEATDEVTRALLNDDEPLTDEQIDALTEAAQRIDALTRTLSKRVPDEGQAAE